MAFGPGPLVDYLQSLLFKQQWGSSLMATAAGSTASVHGTDPLAWTMDEAFRLPEPIPVDVSKIAEAAYTAMTSQMILAGSGKQYVDSECARKCGYDAACMAEQCLQKTKVDECIDYCRKRYWVVCNPITALLPATRCECEKECERTGGTRTQVGLFGSSRGRPGESEASVLARELAPWVIGTGLVLLGAWTLVR